MRRRNADHQRGVSLVESIVSLALLAFLALLMLQGLAAGQNVWRGAAARAATAESIEGAQAVLRERLARVYPATRYDAPLPYPDFDGTATALGFNAPLPEAAGPGATQRYVLSVGPGGDLTLAGHSDLWGRADGPAVEQVLLRGVQGLDIAYLPAGEATAGVWTDRWFKEPALPALVKLRVRFPPGDQRWWPDLLVHPMATTDGDCVLDDGGARCAGRG
ncbi:hypothetical protein D3874_13720 [Oleomonas cavernae]|uniref:Prepilin-type N-terminal cleavage/methylation domain-containing protein n=1 Tax=Oleomonas cavernae TaxID=2320859 RepID=A0A418WDA8_9PROT|nr:prepilin-type N-terminal cleavage/methylation domain-containing protein [Oleomonas cavernae]RJF87948.1 hypothetical protein D3874_13720 [Oleomonas cavernae]